MKHPLKILRFFVPVFLFFAAAKANAEDSRVRVGAILPLSGDAAGVGEAMRNGITLALEEIPPDIRARIEVVYEDDAFSSVRAVSAFGSLMNSGGVHVLLSAGSGTSTALAPIAEQRKVAMLAIASDPKVSRGRKYVFNFFVTPEEESRVVWDEAYRRGYRKIMRVATLHEGPLALKAALDSFNDGRFKVVLDEEYPADQRDFRSLIAKMSTIGEVDGVMVLLLPGQCGLFAKQLREAGKTQPLFAVEVFEDPNEVQVSNGALVGQWYVNADEPDEAFALKYRSRFPKSSLWGALNSHDSILLVADALKKGYAPNAIASYLGTLKDFRGALGTYSATGDGRFTLPAALKVVTPTGFEKLKSAS